MEGRLSGLAMIVLVFVGGCASSRTREPAADARTDRLIQLHAVGQGLLAEFDRQLFAGPSKSMLTSEVYARLLAVRELGDETRGGVASGTAEVEWESLPAPPAVDTLIEEEVRARAAVIRPHLLAVRAGPAPKIFPSADSQGNVTGEGFPAGTWALTFDDGPSTLYTPVVLENLRKHRMKATFFILAQELDVVRGFAQAERDAGMGWGNHSWDHKSLILPATDLSLEIAQAAAKDTEIMGTAPAFFRCPYGDGNDVQTVRQKIADNHMIHVYWNVDSLDWQDSHPDSIVKRTLKQMELEHGGVILFHDIHPQSAVASEQLMGILQSPGYRVVTIPQYVDEVNGRR